MRDLLAAGIAYALGSVVWGVVLGRGLHGVDPRDSDNPGASGSVRLFGPAFGIAIGLLDLLKGWAAVLIARSLGASQAGLAMAAIAVVAGHNWPIWFGLRGGGGLAAAAGSLGTIALPQTLLGIAVSLAVAAAYKHPSLYGKLPMAALPAGALVGFPVLVILLWRAGNSAGLMAAAGCLVIIGLRGLQMLRRKQKLWPQRSARDDR